MTQTIEATYEHGMIKPRRKLPYRERAKLTLIVQPNDPVSRTRGALRVPARVAQVLIYDDSLLE